jgi:D-sedoheptulose 7-phosphate isomerase
MRTKIRNEFNEHIKVANLLYKLTDSVYELTSVCINCLKGGGKIIIFGNGGSAADAQHIAAELIGRYKLKRKSLPAIALTTDSSVITSLGNDFGFDQIFSRQIESIANKGDIVIGISTSGTSPNVINAIKLASEKKCTTIGLSGNTGGELNDICDINIVIPSDDTARIQEMHIVIGHTMCHLIDTKFSS